MPPKDEAPETSQPQPAAPGSRLVAPSRRLSSLVLPSFLISLSFFYLQACGASQPTSVSRISFTAGPPSILLSALAIASCIAYWTIRRRREASPASIQALHFLALFPVLVASFRAVSFIWGIILCLSTTECKMAILLAIGGGL